MPDGDEGTVQVSSGASTLAPTREPPVDAFELPDLSNLPFQPASEAPAASSEPLLLTPALADALPKENGAGVPAAATTNSTQDLARLLEDISKIEETSQPPAESSQPLLPTPSMADALPKEPGSGTPPAAADVGADIAKLLGEIQELVAQAEDYAAPPPPPAPEPGTDEGPTWTPSGAKRAAGAKPEGPPPKTQAARKAKKARPPTPAEERAKRKEARARLLMLGLVLLMSSVVAPVLSQSSTTHAYTIASDSMAPTMPKGSFVLAGPGEVHLHDVIVYESQFTGTLQVHRVVEITQDDDGAVTYTARGDHNDAPDSIAIHRDDIHGVVAFNAPFVGYLWLMPAWVQVGIFCSFIVLYLAITFWDARSKAAKRRVKLAAVALVMVFFLVSPYASAAVGPKYPGSAHTFNVGSTQVPWSAGTSNGTAVPSTISGSNHEANATLAPPKLWKEVELWGCNVGGNCNLSVASTAYKWVTGVNVTIDPTLFTPSPTWFLEASMASAAGGNVSVKLYTAAGAAVAGSSASTTTANINTLALARSSGFSLSSATNYVFKALETGGAARVISVKLVTYQQVPTATVTSIRMTTSSSISSGTQVEAPNSVRWTYSSLNFDGTLTTNLECSFNNGALLVTAGNLFLIDNLGNTAATLAPGTSSGEQTKTVAATLTSGRTYHIEYFSGNLVSGFGTLTVYECRVKIGQSGVSFKTTTNYYDHVGRQTSSSTGFLTAGYQTLSHMDTEYNQRKTWFEFTATTTQVTPTVRLKDDTAGATLAGTTTSVSATARTLYTTADLTLNTANGTYTMEFQHATSGQTVTVYNGFLATRVNVTRGHTYDMAVRATPKVSGCTTDWSFTLSKTHSTGTSRLRNATVALRGNGAVQDQVLFHHTFGFNQTVGSAVTVTPGTAVDVLAMANPTSAASGVATTIEADLIGACGGLHTKQHLGLTFA